MNTPIHVDPADLFDWRDNRLSLEEAGYERGAPGDAAEVDGPIARACVCPICGRQMEYWPMRGPAYLAHAVCEPCDKALEF